MSEKKEVTICEAIEAVLIAKLQEFTNDENNALDLVRCVKIYQTIFETLTEIIASTPQLQSLTNESVNYLAQAFYDEVKINGGKDHLDPNIFTQRAKLDNISTPNLALLALVLRGTDLAAPIVATIRKRS
jgi:hypothetical protein